MATRIPAAFYAHIPADERTRIRQRVYGQPSTRWEIEVNRVQEAYNVSRQVVMRILTTDRERLALAYLYWKVNRDG